MCIAKAKLMSDLKNCDNYLFLQSNLNWAQTSVRQQSEDFILFIGFDDWMQECELAAINCKKRDSI